MAKTLTTDALIDYVRTLEGKPLLTRVKKRAFTVAMLADGIEFKQPNRTPRHIQRVMLDKYVKIYDTRRGFKMPPYVKVGLHDSSYFLALVAGMLDGGLLDAVDGYSETLKNRADGVLELELTNVLLRTTRSTRTRERNLEFVATYYGFRADSSLSQVEAGRRFGIAKRQRSLQVLEAFFLNKLQTQDLPSVKPIADELEKHAVISSETFLQMLLSRGLIGKVPSDRGLLDLVQDTGKRCKNYELYSTGFEEETREKYSEPARRYFIRSDLIEALRATWGRLRAAPSKTGFALFEKAIALEGDIPEPQVALLREFLLESPEVRTIENAEGLWYLFEDRVNPLISQLQKVHAVTSQCVLTELINCLCNGMDPSPAPNLVEAWAHQTPLLDVWEGQVSISKETDYFELTPAEADIRDFLLKPETQVTTSPRLVEWMLGKGHPKPTADRIIFRSAFVHVDTSAGHGNYTFSLIGHKEKAPRTNAAERYFQFREKLLRTGKEGTDRSIATTQRKEQTILQDWIFEKQQAHACAICQRVFDRSALRAAHKKPRFSCTPIERLDPHIVMPLCLLGCDFLYEEGYIVIHDGQVMPSALVASPTIEAYLKQIVGQQLSAEWLSGPTSYFRLPGAAKRGKRGNSAATALTSEDGGLVK